MRSRLSLTALSGNPTTVIKGSPGLISVSIPTGYASKPLRPKEEIRANIGIPVW
jgi:hypothetical protein